jgi:thiamine-phosphate pyrophosphorylase
MSQRFDPLLYLVIDPRACRLSPAAVLTAALGAGVTLVQLRDKRAGTRQQVDLARELLAVLAGSGVPLLINDRVDVALAAGAQGVHLGQSDMRVEDARRLLGPDAIIGQTLRSAAEVQAAPVALLDYLSIGAVFATRSKSDAPSPGGLPALRQLLALLRCRTELPVTAISGIDAENCRQVMDCGVEGVAVISAICAAGDPAQATARLRRALDGC